MAKVMITQTTLHDIRQTIFTFFHQMEGVCVNFLDRVQFFRFLKGRCHATNFVLYRTFSLGAKVSQDLLDRFSQSFTLW